MAAELLDGLRQGNKSRPVAVARIGTNCQSVRTAPFERKLQPAIIDPDGAVYAVEFLNHQFRMNKARPRCASGRRASGLLAVTPSGSRLYGIRPVGQSIIPGAEQSSTLP